MTSIRRIDFRLQASVNGAEFEMNGQGIGNAGDGTCELHLAAEPAFPQGFDPVSCPMVCSHPTSTFFSLAENGCESFAQLTDAAYDVEPARDGLVYGVDGELLMHLKVRGSVRIEGDVLISEHVMTGFSKLPPIERTITGFDDYLLPSDAGRVTAVARYGLLTRAGNTLDGITTIPYAWKNGRALAEPMARRVDDIQVDWDGGTQVHAYYQTRLRNIAQVPAEFAGLPAVMAVAG